MDAGARDDGTDLVSSAQGVHFWCATDRSVVVSFFLYVPGLTKNALSSAKFWRHHAVVEYLQRRAATTGVHRS